MKKYLKLVVVVAGVTIAVFGNSNSAFARKSNSNVGRCNSSNDDCGTSDGGQAICGTYIAG